MRAIVCLTVAEGKRLIAKAVARMPEVIRAQQSGRILLKGGTTVSAIAEELVGAPMQIYGRISPRGLKMSRVISDFPHSMLIEAGSWRDVHGELPEVVASLGEGDVFVTGANVIDVHGGAANMGGGTLGGPPGGIMTGIMVEGVVTIVAAGLEKLIPGTVDQAVRAAGRKNITLSMGMAVGLMPIYGQVVTELEAIKMLAPVECQVVGKGGVDGAEGGVALVVSGRDDDVESVFRLVLELKGSGTSGAAESLPECEQASRECRGHRACIYRSPQLLSRRNLTLST